MSVVTSFTKIENIEQLKELISASRAFQVLQVSNKLRIFDMLTHNPLTKDEIAEKCEAEPEKIEKLLIALTALGLIKYQKGKYTNSTITEQYLVSENPLFQGDWIEHASQLTIWNNLEEYIGGRNLYKEKKDTREVFIRAMHNLAMRGNAEKLAKLVRLNGRKLLFDLGGGPGTYSIALCKNNPELEAIVFDISETTAITREIIKESRMKHRISIREGDWNKDDFGEEYDVVLMSNILHGIGSQAKMKLRKVFKSMVSGGLLIVRDFFLNDSKTGPTEAALFNLMIGAYSKKEITNLVKSNGFTNINIINTDEHSVLLAKKP